MDRMNLNRCTIDGYTHGPLGPWPPAVALPAPPYETGLGVSCCLSRFCAAGPNVRSNRNRAHHICHVVGFVLFSIYYCEAYYLLADFVIFTGHG